MRDRTILRRWGAAITLLLAALWVRGGELRFRSIDVSDGLPHNTVFCIMQDSRGFMWFGTRFGLCRYDGETFTTYNAANSGLGNHTVRDIVQRDDSLLYIATENGIYLSNVRNHTIRPVPLAEHLPRTVDLALDAATGELWVATEGDGVYRLHEGRVSNYPQPATVTAVLCDSRGRVFAATPGEGGGLLLYDRAADAFRPIAPASLNAWTLYESPSGEVWVGTQGRGLVRVQADGTLSGPFSLGPTRNGNIVRAVADMGSELYVATEGGLAIWDKASGQTRHIVHQPDRSAAIADNSLYAICRDREGGVWIGTYFRGISYLSPVASLFEVFPGERGASSLCGYAISAFNEWDGRIIVASEDNGFCFFDPRTQQFSPFTGRLSYINVHDVCPDDRGRLWIGMYLHGIDLWDARTGRMGRVEQLPGEGIHSRSILRLVRDRQGNIHIGTTAGAAMWDASTGRIARMEITRGCVIRDIFEDHLGNIWYASMNLGLFRYTPSTGRWAEYSVRTGAIPTDKTVCVRNDPQGNIWVGTEGFGLLRFDYESGAFEIFDMDDGLSNNFIFSIEYSEDCLWIGTTNGLCRYRPGQRKSKVYTDADGLPSPYFNYNASRRMADGELYFGTVNGFFRFNPAHLGENAFPPPVYVTSLTVPDRQNGPAVRYDDIVALNGGKECITLPYNRNSLEISFAALSYSQPAENRYSCYLQGFEQQWGRETASRTARYSNIPPGSYTFLVRGANSDGVWSGQPVELHITIRQPLWATGWAVGVYVLLVAGLLWLTVHTVQRREKTRHRRDIERRQKQADASKIEFFTNITHEIKTPLSLLKAPVELLLRDPVALPPALRTNVEIMDRNVRWLEKLVRELLEFRQLEEKQYVLRPSRVDVVALLEAQVANFASYAQGHGIALHFLCKTECPLWADLDEDALTKAVSNLLTNALKYTRDRIVVSLRAYKDGRLVIAVHDNGSGIEPQNLGRIFEPFTQFDPSKRFKGIGIGLAFARSLIALHGGTLRVASRPGRWTVASITLPRENPELMAAAPVASYRPEPVEMTDPAIALPEAPEGDDLHLKRFGEDHQLDGHILFVEDTLDIAQTVVGYMKGKYCIGYSNNALDALHYIEVYQPDVVVSDIIMPGMDGIELCRRIKSDEYMSHTGVILLTAKTTDADRLAGLESGANAYICKPFSLRELEVTIDNLLCSRIRLHDWVLRADTAPQDDPLPGEGLSAADHDFVMKVSKIISENVNNPDFRTDDLASMIGMSRSLVYIKLKKLLNVSANEYLQNLRFERACRMLREGGQTISQIAYSLGFTDPNYFSRAFRKHFGVTPSEYRGRY